MTVLASDDTKREAIVRTYRRADLCLLAGVHVDRFKSMARKDREDSDALPLLPFTRDPEERTEYAKYRWEEVLLLAVTVRLGDQIGYAAGLSPRTASSITANSAGAILDADRSKDEPDQWIGYAGAPIELGSNLGGFHVQGTLEEVMAALQVPDRNPVRVFLVNVSAVIREVRQRALKHAIELE